MTTSEPRIIKPEDVRKGDRVRATYQGTGYSTTHEGVACTDGNERFIYIGVLCLGVSEATVELLDRPKTPGEIFYEAFYAANPYVTWAKADRSVQRRVEQAVQAVIDHAANQAATP